MVGTRSVAVAAAALDKLSPSLLLAVSASTAATALARPLVRLVAPADLIPPYWVFMGTAAISVLAGANLLELPSTGGLVPRQVTAGLSIVLWSFCTWLIPLLLALGVWRHVPLRYETACGAWSSRSACTRSRPANWGRRPARPG